MIDQLKQLSNTTERSSADLMKLIPDITKELEKTKSELTPEELKIFEKENGGSFEKIEALQNELNKVTKSLHDAYKKFK